MGRLNETRVLLGVSGGIAAYKAPALVRALQAEGAKVRVVLTKSAEEFVSPLVLQTLTASPVGRSLFDPGWELQIGHIELARWADVVLVAPATANVIGKLANGIADDLLTTVLLATTAPVLIGPAMNTQMLSHAAVRQNLARLRARAGHTIVEPDEGSLACGEVGPGRLPDPDAWIAEIERVRGGGLLAGRRVCVTAGPTREHFDPVRFNSNPSSGKMGYAIARAAWAAGADVSLISGPVALAAPYGVPVQRVETAEDMYHAVMRTPSDLLIMAAAVADYRPDETLSEKKKKEEGDWVPRLVRTRDILAELNASPQRPPVVVGFAAETEDIEGNALGKLERKGLDGIIANSVKGPSGAFGNDENHVVLLTRAGARAEEGPAPKWSIARSIVAWAATLPPRNA